MREVVARVQDAGFVLKGGGALVLVYGSHRHTAGLDFDAERPTDDAWLHIPHTSTGVPSNSSLRRKIFSFHGFALRSKITKCPASAPHRSM